MISALIRGKISSSVINEDTLTSSVFNLLLYLPIELTWSILRNSCLENQHLPLHPGSLIKYDFWPKWDPSETNNTRYVEPDLFIEFDEFSIIIEAKRWDSSQMHYNEQWTKEITAFNNYFSRSQKTKPAFFIAAGWNKSPENILFLNSYKDISIFKCPWISILKNITNISEHMETSQFTTSHQTCLKRILEDMITLFKIHGITLPRPRQYFDSLVIPKNATFDLSINYLTANTL